MGKVHQLPAFQLYNKYLLHIATPILNILLTANNWQSNKYFRKYYCWAICWKISKYMAVSRQCRSNESLFLWYAHYWDIPSRAHRPDLHPLHVLMQWQEYSTACGITAASPRLLLSMGWAEGVNSRAAEQQIMPAKPDGYGFYFAVWFRLRFKL